MYVIVEAGCVLLHYLDIRVVSSSLLLEMVYMFTWIKLTGNADTVQFPSTMPVYDTIPLQEWMAFFQ